MKRNILIGAGALVLIGGITAFLIVHQRAEQNLVEPTSATSTEQPVADSLPPPNSKLPAGSATPGDPSLYKSRTWVWQKTVMSDGSTVVPRKAGAFSITFANDGKVTGKTDCNGFFGSYKFGSDGVLSFGPLASTLMYCESSQELEFTTMISKVKRYSFGTDGSLTLHLVGDSGTILFKENKEARIRP